LNSKNIKTLNAFVLIFYVFLNAVEKDPKDRLFKLPNWLFSLAFVFEGFIPQSVLNFKDRL